MKKAIEEYLDLSKEKKEELWNHAIFVFDTNILLNFYRYSSKVREQLWSSLESLHGRIWMPYYAANEYMKNRGNLIYEMNTKCDNLKKDSEKFVQNVIAKTKLTDNDDNIKSLKKYINEWIDAYEKINHLEVSYDDDEILKKLLKLYDKKCGRKYSEDRLDALKAEGEDRFINEKPPGYKDKNKDHGLNGDYFIWKEILDYAKENKADIIFVTEDKKEDWWNIIEGKKLGPRIELVEEFVSETKRYIHFYTTMNFLQIYAEKTDKEIGQDVYDEINNFGKKQEFEDMHIIGKPESLRHNIFAKKYLENTITYLPDFFVNDMSLNELLEKYREYSEIKDFILSKEKLNSNDMRNIEQLLRNMDQILDYMNKILNSDEDQLNEDE